MEPVQQVIAALVLGLFLIYAMSSKKSTSSSGSEINDPENSNNTLLNEARDWVGKGDSSKAMECMISAIREKYGDAKVMKVLAEAKKSHQEDHRELLRKAVSGEGTLLSEEYCDAAKCIKQSVKSGESRVCTRCGDVVATTRLDAHSKFWCSANPDVDSD